MRYQELYAWWLIGLAHGLLDHLPDATMVQVSLGTNKEIVAV